MLKARIIITAFNSDDDLYLCVNSLQAQSRKDFEAVVVNNHRVPIKPLDVWENYHWLTVLEFEENTGFSGGSNRGAIGAKTEWIITLNPDSRPDKNWFAKLMAGAAGAPEYDMLSSTTLKAGAPDILDGAGDFLSIYGVAWRAGQGAPLTRLPKRHRPVLSPCGAAAAYRRNIFEDNSGFDTAYFCYLEDIDFALRLQSKGHKCLHVFDAYVTHVGGGSTGENSAFQFYYTHKNQLRVICKLAPFPILILQIPLYFAVQAYLLIRTIGTKNWYSKVKGIRDGILSCPEIIFKERIKIQCERKLSTKEYSKLLSWSLRDISQKSMDI